MYADNIFIAVFAPKPGNIWILVVGSAIHSAFVSVLVISVPWFNIVDISVIEKLFVIGLASVLGNGTLVPSSRSFAFGVPVGYACILAIFDCFYILIYTIYTYTFHLRFTYSMTIAPYLYTL